MRDAEAVASVLVYADLRGYSSHGVYRVPAYLRRVRHGLAGGTQDMKRLGGSGAMLRMDAGFALGPAAAVRCTDLALTLAAEHGVGVVSVGRSTHLGATGYYARRVAERGMAGLVLSNGPKAVAPYGAAEPFLGTNPLAFGIPLGRHGCFVLDMATSVVSRERVRMLAASGGSLAAGLAIDGEGKPTTDAWAALSGSVLPVGGAKGSGLSMAITLLVGMLAQADFDDEIGSMYQDFDRPQNVGHIFIVMDPAWLGPAEGSIARGEALVDRLHGLRTAEGTDRVRFNGERGEECARRNRAAGIPIDPAVLERLAESCVESGMPETAARARALASRPAGGQGGDGLSG